MDFHGIADSNLSPFYPHIHRDDRRRVILVQITSSPLGSVCFSNWIRGVACAWASEAMRIGPIK
jgi:hypothetical protein